MGARARSDREYRGVKYRYKADDDLAAAVVDHAVLIGTERGFKSAIDARSGDTLASSATFKKARETVGTDGLGFAYADPGRFFDLAAGAASGKAPGVDDAQLKMFKGLLTGSGLQSVAAKLDVASNALADRRRGDRAQDQGRQRRRSGRGGRGAGGLVAERRRR